MFSFRLPQFFNAGHDNGSLIGQKVRVCPHIFYYMTLMALSLADLKRKCGGGGVELLCWRK